MAREDRKDTNTMLIYGIPRSQRRALRAVAQRRKYRSTSEMIRVYIERILREETKLQEEKEAS